MAIRYQEPAKPAPPLLEKAKEIRRQAEALEAEVSALAEKRGPGRKHSGKETVTLRVDAAVVDWFKKSYGDDWRSRMARELSIAAGR